MAEKKEIYIKPALAKVGNIRNKTFHDSNWSCSIDGYHYGGDDDSGHYRHHH